MSLQNLNTCFLSAQSECDSLLSHVDGGVSSQFMEAYSAKVEHDPSFCSYKKAKWLGNSGVVEFTTNRTNKRIFFPAVGFLIASRLVPYYQELLKYRQCVIQILEDNGTNLDEQEDSNGNVSHTALRYVDASYRVSTEEKEWLKKFLAETKKTANQWWGKGKEIKRTNDFFVSPLMKAARLNAESQNEIAEVAKQLSENPDLLALLIAGSATASINGQSETPMTNVDRLTVALKLYAEKRAVDRPGGWASYDEWTHGVRSDFVAVDESLLADPTFNYLAYIRKYTVSGFVANTSFARHTSDEKREVLKFLKGQKDLPNPASWYIDEANRLVVGGSQVKGMSPKAVLYFMSELHPEEFAAWTEPTYEQLAFLGLHKGATPSDLTIETYEDCKSKQQQIVARMKELGIGKASDDPSAPDYRTANEFLWWLGQDDNKDLIKEKVMSKVMKKPTTKQITTGKATISGLLTNQEDSLMTMLIAGLLTKPLAILAGVSGTGKSRMVRHLAYKTCLDEDLKPENESAPGNFKMVQVKPSWHDSADLLGYRSAVNEKHEYVSTDFVKFVLKAHAYPKTPFFVCLDEMNLAPVEHYFAEFLSACESIRKSDVTGEWTSDPIVAATDFDNNVLNLGGDVLFESADAALDAALKKTRVRIEKEGLFIPRNLFVVGTVNMDDSTGGFSRKVLDRAMTIVMNEVHFEDLQKEDKDLTLSDDNLFTTAEIAKFIERKDFIKDMISDAFRDQLENIRQKLAKTPFALAYRFARETCMYKNALKEILDAAEVVKDSEGNPKKDASGAAIDADRACGDIALDHMILMKLLPRLTGTTEQRSDVLKDIKEYLGKLVKDKKVSAVTLDEMEERAKSNGGYLSFWP